MRIGEVAAATGVPVKTLRYWEQVGVLPGPPREPSGYRSYPPATVDQVRFIVAAQSVGLSLQVIGGILQLRSQGSAPCEHVEALLRKRLVEIDRKMELLESTRSEVERLLERARGLNPTECDERSVCHVLVM